MGAISTVKTENGKVTCETAEGSVINININQRSALDCMLDAIKALRMKKISIGDKPAVDKPAQETGSAITLGLGVSFISVGFLCVVLAVIFAVSRPWLTMFYTVTHFWVGFPLIASGILTVVNYRHPNPFWTAVTFISHMACLAVSIAGLVFAVDDIERFPWWSNECDDLVTALRNRGGYNNNYNGYYNGYNDGYFRTEPPRYIDNYNYEYQLNDCKRAMNIYKTMLFGLVIMSLLIIVWGICASVIALGFRLKAVYTSCKCENLEEEDTDEPMLSANPPNDVIIA